VKVLSIILLILMTSLSGFPCDDHHEDTGHETHSHSQNDNGDTDDCSPFCICQCCQTLALVASVDFDDLYVVFPDIDYNSFDEDINQYGQFSSIWNPPKKLI